MPIVSEISGLVKLRSSLTLLCICSMISGILALSEALQYSWTVGNDGADSFNMLQAFLYEFLFLINLPEQRINKLSHLTFQEHKKQFESLPGDFI